MTNIESVEQIQQFIISTISSVCGLPSKALYLDASLQNLGIDSMIAVNINMVIEKELGIDLPFNDIANGATIEFVSDYLYKQLNAKFVENEALPEIVSQNTSFQDLMSIPESFYKIKKLPFYNKISSQKSIFLRAGVPLPFFNEFDGVSRDVIKTDSSEMINFASYNYLGYCGHPEVNEAAKNAIDLFGTSAASSRIVSGQKPIHKQLEDKIANLYGAEDAIVLVSGYLTNLSIIGHLMGPRDLIIHDSFAHNSIVKGCQLSGATRISFPHNDIQILESILSETRNQYERVLIVVEGLYSMDGDICPLPELIRIKDTFKALLMVDEAHSIGILGQKGLGVREFFNVPSDQVDIWMGTLSKTFAGCGGYIAGCKELIEYLKYTAPGFVYSVGLSPPIAAASICAIDLLLKHQCDVKNLQENSQYFLAQAKLKGLNTGLAEGFGIVPVIISESLKTVKIANSLFNAGINVQPIIYPVIQENAARLRFFISALHSKCQIDKAIDLTVNLINEYAKEVQSD